MSVVNKFAPKMKPVDEKGPSDADRFLDGLLKSYIDVHMPQASREDSRLRDEVLAAVERTFIDWVKEVAISENRTEDEIEDCGGQIQVSGSHRLGIRDIGADIDAVCIAPQFCTLEYFFSTLRVKFLEKPEVTDLIAISGAAVPVLSFDYRGISIDLLFVRLTTNTVPMSLDILDDRVLFGLDERSEKSINGPRVTNMISKMVGLDADYQNEDHPFRMALRCVRKWAKQRGLYGNKFGYLGGVNCNLLVAFIKQLYPNASFSKLLIKFFQLFGSTEEGLKWRWPQPVMLNEIQPNPPTENRVVWTARENPRHVMPIITPAYPAMNSAANVSPSSLEVMQQEFQRGLQCIKSIIQDGATDWGRLFESSDFFIKYSYYLCCHIIGNGEDEDSRSWISFVESRIRQFISPMYLGSEPVIKSPIHLYPVMSKTKKSAKSVCYFIGFNIDDAKFGRTGKALHLENHISRFRGYLDSTGLRKEGFDFFVESYSWKRLPAEVFEPLGGKDAAKALRQTRGYSTIKASESTTKATAVKDAESNNSSATALLSVPPGNPSVPTEAHGATVRSEDVANTTPHFTRKTNEAAASKEKTSFEAVISIGVKRFFTDTATEEDEDHLLKLLPVSKKVDSTNRPFSAVSWIVLDK